jgi:3-oxoacyl-[acyl-carrier protein] reductase
MRKLPPLERLGQPKDIASVVSFLACPEGSWFNAHAVRINDELAQFFQPDR